MEIVKKVSNKKRNWIPEQHYGSIQQCLKSQELPYVPMFSFGLKESTSIEMAGGFRKKESRRLLILVGWLVFFHFSCSRGFLGNASRARKGVDKTSDYLFIICEWYR